MKLYYASIYEYIAIWGTPIGSEGHSRRHRVGLGHRDRRRDVVLPEGEFDKRVYKPGDRVTVGPGDLLG